MAEKEKKEIHFKIDGKEVVGHPGETVIAVAHREGIPVPHYCYHPDLEIDGNCRMCIAKFAAPRGGEVVPFPKPMTTCTTYPSEGMEVDTKSQEVSEMRRDIMEFLLINHPLDCPICDQAGECTLQDYAYKFGRGKGRFKEEKVHKHTKELGEHVSIWGERCIVCTRCIRFLDEVSGTSELCVVNRADKSVVDRFDEKEPLDNPLSLNVVDICPVGALVSNDFLYSQRAWYLKSRDSVCAACSKGCNIVIDYDQRIRRIRSRPNPDVNGYWMCDYGRMFFKHTHSEDRLGKFYLREEDKQTAKANHLVLEETVEKLKSFGEEGEVALLGSLFLTCESLYLLKEIGDELGVEEVGALARPEEEAEEFPGFTIEGDKNPNRRGFEAVFGKDSLEKGLENLIESIEKGEVKGLLIASAVPEFEVPEELVKVVDELEFLAIIDILKSPLSEKAHAVMAGSTYTEQGGLYVNSNGKYQRLRPALMPPERAEKTDSILQKLLYSLQGEKKEPLSLKKIREDMFKSIEALAEMEEEKSYPELGNLPQGTVMLEQYYSGVLGERL